MINRIWVIYIRARQIPTRIADTYARPICIEIGMRRIREIPWEATECLYTLDTGTRVNIIYIEYIFLIVFSTIHNAAETKEREIH